MHCRNRNAFLMGTVASLGLWASIAATAQASVTTIGCSNANVACTLEELSNGSSFIIDDVNFDNWGITDFSSVPIDLSTIDVRPLNDQPNSVGLAFQAAGGLNTAGFDLIDLSIGFTVSAAIRSITGVSFELTEFDFGAANVGGFVNGFEDIRDGLGGLIGDLFVEADSLTPPILNPIDTLSFSSESALLIEKTILVSGDAIDDLVALDEFVQRFSLVNGVPEPTSPVLLISGLIVLLWSRRIKQAVSGASA